jgi:hypothetical protein
MPLTANARREQAYLVQVPNETFQAARIEPFTREMRFKAQLDLFEAKLTVHLAQKPILLGLQLAIGECPWILNDVVVSTAALTLLNLQIGSASQSDGAVRCC